MQEVSQLDSRVLSSNDGRQVIRLVLVQESTQLKRSTRIRRGGLRFCIGLGEDRFCIGGSLASSDRSHCEELR